MHDHRPSAAYTIDDLDTLTQLMEAERATSMLRVLLPGQETERDDDGLITTPSNDDHPRYLAECALAGGDDARTLRVLAASSFREVRSKVAANPHTPAGALIDLATSRYLIISSAAAGNPALSAADVEFLAATVDHPGLRMGVAGNPNTPQHLIDRLTGDPWWWVRVITIRRCSWPLLQLLATDPDDVVRCHVGHSDRLSIALCEALASDPDHGVRKAIGGNRATPPSVLDTLAQDARWPVRKSVAGNPQINSDQARLLMADPSEHVREAVAGNSSTPGDVLTALARPRNRCSIRMAVADNPACPQQVRARLATRDRSRYVRQRATDHAARSS